MLSALLDKMWEYQEKINMPQEEREEMATEVGLEFRKLIMKYTNIDTHKIYNNE